MATFTDFQGNSYTGSFLKSDGSSYNGNLTDFQGNLIDSSESGPWDGWTTKDWYENCYIPAKTWLTRQNGVKGIIVTDTHHGASKKSPRDRYDPTQSNFNIHYSHAIRSVHKIQEELEDVLFLQLGDYLDTASTPYKWHIEDPEHEVPATYVDIKYDSTTGQYEHSDRCMHLIGNHDIDGTSEDIKKIRQLYFSLMDSNSITKLSDYVYYKDFKGIRFIAINKESSWGTADFKTALTQIKEGAQKPDGYVVLSHWSPHLTTKDGAVWSTGPALSGSDTMYTCIKEAKIDQEPILSKYIGHWTGHNHHDGYMPSYINGQGNEIGLYTTLGCDFCSSDYSKWTSAGSRTDGAMTCFNIDLAHHTVEYKRFGAVRYFLEDTTGEYKGDYFVQNGTTYTFEYWMYNWVSTNRDVIFDVDDDDTLYY